jgi:hypothetical protein
MAGHEGFDFFSSWLKKLVIGYSLMISRSLLLAPCFLLPSESVTSSQQPIILLTQVQIHYS